MNYPEEIINKVDLINENRERELRIINERYDAEIRALLRANQPKL